MPNLKHILHISLERAVLPIVGVVAVAATVISAPAAQASPGRSEPDRFAHQKLTWKKCQLNAEDELGKQLDQAGGQCATVTVPLDYSRPGGRTITVAISRIKATDTKRRIGTLVIDGGGPGGGSIDMPLYTRQAMGELAKRYDLVGMDPRSNGRSTPVDCGWPTGSMIRSAGFDRADFERSVAFARDLAERCGRSGSEVLPYVSTRNIARDMELVRAVLGERKLSYLGYSWGSYLGAVYAELYPHRLDRFVLDGPMNPDTYTPGLLRNAGPANEQALRDWASWVADRNATYGLGRTQAEVLATVNSVIAASRREPLRVGDFRLDVNLTPTLFFAMLGSDQDEPRAELAQAARVLTDAAEQGSAHPHESLRQFLAYLATAAGSPYGSAQAAILCGDAATPNGDVERYWRNIERDRAAMPYASPVVHNINPCEFWPTTPREPLTRVRTSVPALVVAATGDPRTVYENAEPLRRALGPGSRLVTMRGANQHGVYGEYGNACVDKVVNAYLASGRLPQRDLTCDR